MNRNHDATGLDIRFLYFDGPFLGSPSMLVDGVDVYTNPGGHAGEELRRLIAPPPPHL